MQPNRSGLQQLAAPTGGQLIELGSMNMNEAVQMAGKEQILLMDLASASGKSLVETPLQEQRGQLLVTGVMHENVDTLLLTYGNTGMTIAVEKLVLKTSDACAAAAIDRIGMLLQFDSVIKTGNWQHILAFGKKHKVVTPHSSMIVLERIEDYVTYDIEPPQELKEACEALYVKKNKVDRWKLFKEWNAYDVLTNVTNRYNQRIRWWDPSHPMIALAAPGSLQGAEKINEGGMAVKDVTPGALQGKAAGFTASSNSLQEVVVVGYGQHSRRLNTSSATTVIRHHEFPLAAQSVEQALAGRVPGMQVQAGTPGGSAAVQIRGLSSLSNQQPLFVLDGHPVSGNINDLIHIADIDRIEVMKSAHATSYFGSQGANGVIVLHTKKGSRQNYHYSQEPYRLKDQEDVAYIQEIKAVPKADKWRAYQQLRSYYESSAGFYLDMAQHFFEAGQKQQAMEILANAAEAGGGSPEILKAIGYTLESWKAFDEVVMIYEQLLQAQPEALVSHRNLAWAYYQKGAYQKAVDLLYQAISSNWEHQEAQLGSTKSLLLTELNAIIALHKNEVDISRIDAALLRPLPVDLRIVMDCNKPLYYNQFQMVEPGGKVASHAYYDHSAAKGVFQNKDYYHGMHPAEYEIKTAVNGKYTVRLQHWDAYPSNRLIPTMIRIVSFKNFGKKGQAISIENVIVDNQNGVVDIAEVRY
jgi:TonB-dependent SusC/RagA subfamily outer membrane receptor